MTQESNYHPKSSLTVLCSAYALLVVYASLYPFIGWRSVGLPVYYFWNTWPHFWSRFDVIANVLAYIPLGFFASLYILRYRMHTKPERRVSTTLLFFAVFIVCALLSFALECIQVYLPNRVPSMADFALNALGAFLGIVFAFFSKNMWFRFWGRIRRRWLDAYDRWLVFLLFVWPFALLFPTVIPFGMGQVYEKLESALAQFLQGTPFLELIPVREIEFQPMLPVVQFLCVALGLWTPFLLSYLLVYGTYKRLLMVFTFFVLACGVLTLTTALSFAPEHAYAWLTPAGNMGILFGVVLALCSIRASRRLTLLLLIVELALQLTFLNQSSTNLYLELVLEQWEQGRFIHFYGITQWLSWLWPYAVFVLAFRFLLHGWDVNKPTPIPAPVQRK